jgi:hypothetical protein
MFTSSITEVFVVFVGDTDVAFVLFYSGSQAPIKIDAGCSGTPT